MVSDVGSSEAPGILSGVLGCRTTPPATWIPFSLVSGSGKSLSWPLEYISCSMTSVDRGDVRGSYKKDTTARNALTVTRAQQGEQNHNVYSVLQIVLLNQLIG